MAKLLREQLIKHLATGQFVSGQQLAEQLGVSRTAIAKHVKALTEMGLDIFSVRGKGYKLAQPITLLDQQCISKHLATLGATNVVDVHTLIDSTNSYLMRRLPNRVAHQQVCIAEYQSAGRGRRGKQWHSPFASHLYMSMYWQLEQGLATAMGISLVVGLAVSDVLINQYQLPAQVKWPNDIYINGKKLAGILLELEGASAGAAHCVIGLGLNVNMPSLAASKIGQPWTDLNQHVGTPLDRNLLSAQLIYQLNIRLNQHRRNGLAPMLDDWRKRDYFYNRDVQINSANKTSKGVCRGINQNGALLLEIDGKVQSIYGGEISLRGVE
ncbi:bifunctional biotin--[acetyl-CoA-carboxylase] ligase/biotin operon repressor BirA [Thalassotalea ponticola]|uniref:bifunctional biotin--[acetyl-CoA-carboxylase] ligase/biotin operon repressor BirA n=1 Tax=Thalassotalea ponticola TaxID=1523392 RepID=UPI0025B31DEB|nr:bifunctional biotin--[acetyl-CoA-carboxylase] ligase/biotin operon repressor BirA [Thalassotalea ponticola]MDN3652825.1 bifunctional biotin--[acetyl-CoA-carboxylase] ligase/biotin operon repressor BirA [Thalassotalea ponticola]